MLVPGAGQCRPTPRIWNDGSNQLENSAIGDAVIAGFCRGKRLGLWHGDCSEESRITSVAVLLLDSPRPRGLIPTAAWLFRSRAEQTVNAGVGAGRGSRLPLGFRPIWRSST